MIKNNRKEVDNFLIELDKFIDKNINLINEDELFDFILPLRAGLPSSFWPKDSIDFLILDKLINKEEKKGVKKKVIRWSNFTRRVAYKLEYVKVKWDSYNEIFSKILLQRWNKEFSLKWLRLEKFYETNPGKEFLILKDYWQIDFDMIFLWNYKIIK